MPLTWGRFFLLHYFLHFTQNWILSCCCALLVLGWVILSGTLTVLLIVTPVWEKVKQSWEISFCLELWFGCSFVFYKNCFWIAIYRTFISDDSYLAYGWGWNVIITGNIIIITPVLKKWFTKICIKNRSLIHGLSTESRVIWTKISKETLNCFIIQKRK